MEKKMDLAVYGITKVEVNRKKLPEQFSELIRPDLIERAVFAIQSHKKQPYGASPEAGKRHSARISRRRHKYKTSYGHGISRVPRKIMSHRGERFNWVGALAPGTVGGRRAHPPKAEKIVDQKINKKERKKAIRSALAATLPLTHPLSCGPTHTLSATPRVTWSCFRRHCRREQQYTR